MQCGLTWLQQGKDTKLNLSFHLFNKKGKKWIKRPVNLCNNGETGIHKLIICHFKGRIKHHKATQTYRQNKLNCTAHKHTCIKAKRQLAHNSMHRPHTHTHTHTHSESQDLVFHPFESCALMNSYSHTADCVCVCVSMYATVTHLEYVYKHDSYF